MRACHHCTFRTFRAPCQQQGEELMRTWQLFMFCICCAFWLQGIEFDEDMAALEEQFGTPRGQPGQWAACLRIVDPATLSTGDSVVLGSA
eukprot:1159776-Pelagomonas_calceolata.AAC.3